MVLRIRYLLSGQLHPAGANPVLANVLEPNNSTVQHHAKSDTQKFHGAV